VISEAHTRLFANRWLRTRMLQRAPQTALLPPVRYRCQRLEMPQVNRVAALRFMLGPWAGRSLLDDGEGVLEFSQRGVPLKSRTCALD
jgi:hypothetical protein